MPWVTGAKAACVRFHESPSSQPGIPDRPRELVRRPEPDDLSSHGQMTLTDAPVAVKYVLVKQQRLVPAPLFSPNRQHSSARSGQTVASELHREAFATSTGETSSQVQGIRAWVFAVAFSTDEKSRKLTVV